LSLGAQAEEAYTPLLTTPQRREEGIMSILMFVALAAIIALWIVEMRTSDSSATAKPSSVEPDPPQS